MRYCADGGSLDPVYIEAGLRAFTRTLRLVLDPDPGQVSGLPAAMPAHMRLLDAGERMLG